MKRIILLFIVFSLFAGCVTQKKCLSKFPPKTSENSYDSISVRDSIVYRDRIVPYYIRGEVIRKDSLIPGIPEKINTKPFVLENKYATAKAWIQNSMLKMQLFQKDQVIKFRLDSADKIAKHWEYKYTHEKQKEVVIEKYIPKIYKDALWICILLFSAAFMFFGWKAYKFFRP